MDRVEIRLFCITDDLVALLGPDSGVIDPEGEKARFLMTYRGPNRLANGDIAVGSYLFISDGPSMYRIRDSGLSTVTPEGLVFEDPDRLYEDDDPRGWFASESTFFELDPFRRYDGTQEMRFRYMVAEGFRDGYLSRGRCEVIT